MPSLKTIKRRIASVKNTQKITKAMKMVAAAKLRRAQQAVLNARHYTQAILSLSDRLILSQRGEGHLLSTPREKVVKRDYLILTSDRGLCGGFNSNLLRKLGDELVQCREEGIQTECRIIGKKGRDYFKAKNWAVSEAATGLYDHLDRSISEKLGSIAMNRFATFKTDEVWIVFNYFKSVMAQQSTLQKILPIDSTPSFYSSPLEGEESRRGGRGIDYIYEPDAAFVLGKLLKERIVSQIHQAFLESIVSEFAARMAAMDNATSNASDMISYLTLQYNRARQASITKELMDIVNGAEALK